MTDRELMQQALEALVAAYQGKDKAGQVTEAITAIREALAEQPAQQEPVAWVCYGATVNHHDIDFDQNEIDAIPLGTMLYTSPQPSKPWVGLTLGEAVEIWTKTKQLDTVIKLVEAKLKEKNAPQQSKEDA